MDGYPFAAEIRVRFADTDAQGVVHNSNYVIWFEVARVEFLEKYAGGYQKLRDLGLESLVLESHAHFKQPAYFDDRLQIHTKVHSARGARFRFDYVVARGDEVLADGWTMHATVNAETLRPTRTPEWLTQALTEAS